MAIYKIFTEFSASISQVKENPNKVLEEAGGAPVVVLANNRPRYYMVPPELYEKMIDALVAQSSVIKPGDHVEGKFRPSPTRLQEIAESCAQYITSSKPAKAEDFQEKWGHLSVQRLDQRYRIMKSLA